MGFAYESASWDAVTGAMYMGANGSAPMIYTLISAALCVLMLWMGNRSEHKMYDDYK
jgi:hypothetical protein